MPIPAKQIEGKAAEFFVETSGQQVSEKIRACDRSDRPPMPPEWLSRCRPGFQFPRTLFLPFLSGVNRLRDAGWLPGRRITRHIVICGFPRSGTTLCQLMLESCLEGVGTWGRERRALEIARCGRRSHSVIVTKRPKDVFLIPEIQELYSRRDAEVLILLMHRDPRAALTSKHFSRPEEYYLTAEQWTHYYRHWHWSKSLPGVMSLSYEELIADPDGTEARVRRFTGVASGRPFRSFQQHVPQGFDLRALNGLRHLDEGRLQAWRSPEHRERILQLLSSAVELQGALEQMGYESDDRWAADFVGGCPSSDLPCGLETKAGR